MINVKESKRKASQWARALGYTFPVLLDLDGQVATRCAPPNVLPVLPRDQVPIASNLIIDDEGRIQFFSLLDSSHFDASLVDLMACLDELLAGRGAQAQPAETGGGLPADGSPPGDTPNWLTLRASVEPGHLIPGERGKVVIRAEIPAGCHIEARKPSAPFLVPTQLSFDADPDLIIGPARYPSASEKVLDWNAAPLRVYSGTVQFEAPVQVAPYAKDGLRRLRALLRYQGCTQQTCLMPTSQVVSAELEIDRLQGGETVTKDKTIPQADAVLDAPGQGCATLTPLMKNKMRELSSGGVLEVRSDDPAARMGVPAWSRLTGNELVATVEESADSTRFYLRKK